ncbi:MAG: hypothetical protein WCK05_08515 [Planctomycetota bacterium]
MRTLRRAVVLSALSMVFCLTPGCGVPTPSQTVPVPFDVHNGYFVSNQFEPDAPTSFVVVKDQKAFDKVFGVAMVMGDKSHRLPPDAFDKSVVVAAIHRGKAVWEYKVENVMMDGKTLIVKYSTATKPSETAEFACPLIVSVQKEDWTAVQFVEDGKTAKRVEIGSSALP